MRRFAPLFVIALFSGCLSGLGGQPQRIRYFSAAAPPTSVSAVSADAPTLRLRRVTTAAHLRDRMVWRTSAVEYGFYETRRWTEQPVAWLEEALSRELFEARGLRRTNAVASTTLEVHLVGFEEVTEPDHRAQVSVVVRLFDASGNSLLEQTVIRSEPIGGSDPEGVARAMSRALGTTTRDVAAIVVGRAAGE